VTLLDERLVTIVLSSGITLAAGLFLIYMGFLSPIFRRSSEALAPDPSVRTFRLIARIMGPLLCGLAGVRMAEDFRRDREPQVLQWREITVPEGRFRVMSPEEFTKDRKDVSCGDWRVTEHCCHAVVPRLGCLVSYLDLPEGVAKLDPAELLNRELDSHVHSGGVTLVSKEPTTFNGYPALHFTLHDVRAGFYVEGTLLLAKQRRYELAVQYTADSSAANRQRFFDSFRILDEK